jgi:drug/metabolite transporter (DMT)-like permease
MIAGALDPILTAVWPMLVLAEFPTDWGYLGCLLILAAVVISQYGEMKGQPTLISGSSQKEEDLLEV